MINKNDIDIVIIGYGNPLREDDGIGWHIAHHLLTHAPFTSDTQVEIIPCHQLSPELAETISHARLALFIDARVGDTPGTIHCENLSPSSYEQESMTHHMTPSNLLTWTQTLYDTCPNAVVLSVESFSFGYNEDMSLAIQQSVPALLAQIYAIVEQKQCPESNETQTSKDANIEHGGF